MEVTVAILYGLVTALALGQAQIDAGDIADELPIDHFARWAYRSTVALGIASTCLSLRNYESSSDLMIDMAASLGGAAFLFSLVFRLRLNSIRKMARHYVAPWGSWYDLGWTSLLACIRRINMPDKKALRASYFAGDKDSESLIHGAGRMASIFEAASAAAAAITLTNT